MRTFAALLLAFALSLNGLAASACAETPVDVHAMSGEMVGMGADMGDGGDMPCDCCDDEQLVDTDCHLMCLSPASVLAVPDLALSAPLSVDAPLAFDVPVRPETRAASPPRRPPRLWS